MQLEHIGQKGSHVTIFLDDRDVKLYRSLRWWIHPRGTGLREAVRGGKARLLHRLILKAPDGVQVRFRNRNKFDFRRENLRLVMTGRPYKNFLKGKAKVHKSKGDEMVGVYFDKNYFTKKPEVRAFFHIGDTFRKARNFSIGDGKSFYGVTLTRTEAYRRAVCWRIGMMLAHGNLPDKASFDIFFREHQKLSPFPRKFSLAIHRDQSVRARIHQLTWRADQPKRGLTKNFYCGHGNREEAMRKAIFWVVGTLLYEDMMPDERSMDLLKKTIAYCYTPPTPEEMYAGNAEYTGKTMYRDEDDEDGRDSLSDGASFANCAEDARERIASRRPRR